MKPLVEDIKRKLDELSVVLRNREFDQWSVTAISELKSSISLTKAPAMPSRALWDKYTSIISLIEEIIRIASRPGYEYAVYDILQVLRSHVDDFKSTLERAYFIERIQLSLPSVLGLSYAITKYLSDQSFSPLILGVAIVSVVFALLNPIIGIVLTGVLGASFLALSGDSGSILTGVLLLSISSLYLYTYMFARSRTFTNKVQSALSNINRLVSSALTPSPVRVEDVLSELVNKENYSIDDTGILKYIDKEELLKYKTTIMIASGRVQQALFISDINQSSYIEMRDKRD